MTASGGIDRRRFLQATLGVGSALALAKLAPWRALVEVVRPPIATRLASLLEHRHSARVVGAEYLRAGPPGADAQTLVDAILADLHGEGARAGDASGAELRQLVAARVRRDFEEGHTLQLRGWIASRTEARLCGLVALEDRARRRTA